MSEDAGADAGAGAGAGAGADGGGATAEEVLEEVNEILTAEQALVVVAIVLVLALIYTSRYFKHKEEARIKSSFMQYDFELPTEKERFLDMAKRKPEDKPENRTMMKQWHTSLMQLHFKRVLKVITLHEKVNTDLRTQTTLYKRGVAVSMLPQIEAAKTLLDREVQECGALANQLKKDWARTIFQEAYKIKEGVDAKNAKEEEEKAREEREKRDAELLRQAKLLDDEEQEMIRKTADEQLETLIAQDEQAKERNTKKPEPKKKR